MKTALLLFFLFLFINEHHAQINITLDAGKGKSKRNIIFKNLADSNKYIILNEEKPDKSLNIELGIEKQFLKNILFHTGISYFTSGFSTDLVKFVPYWAPNGIPGREYYKVKIIEKYLVVPLYIGYRMNFSKRSTLSFYSGVGIIYKLNQKTLFAFKYADQPEGWGKSDYVQREFKFSAQIPLKACYIYSLNRFGVGVHSQYNYVLGKTNTQITDSGYGYIGIEQETSGRMSYWNIGLSFLYRWEKK